jgi:N6-L-threonylcarbamoyladenine synthase
MDQFHAVCPVSAVQPPYNMLQRQAENDVIPWCIERTGLKRLCVGGGVAANRVLRQRLEEETRQAGIELHIAPLQLCTDNAVMGAIAIERLKAGKIEELDLDVVPGLVR